MSANEAVVTIIDAEISLTVAKKFGFSEVNVYYGVKMAIALDVIAMR